MAEKDSFDRASAESDAAFAARVLSGLPSVPVPGTLEARILADFDAVAAKRKASPWAWALHPVRSLRDAVWPDAPAWQPASVFALSLLIGLAAGAFVPSSDVLPDGSSVQSQSLAYDTAPALDLAKDI